MPAAVSQPVLSLAAEPPRYSRGRLGNWPAAPTRKIGRPASLEQLWTAPTSRLAAKLFREGRKSSPASGLQWRAAMHPAERREEKERELEKSEKKRPRARRRHPTDGPTRRGFGVIFAEQPAALAAR